VLYNIARIAEALGRLETAIGHYRDFLAVSDDATANEEVRRRIEEVLAKLAGSKGRLIVQGTPAAAVAVLDGAADGALTLPLDRWLPPGEHTVRLEADGYDPQERTLSLAAGQELRWDFELRRRSRAARSSWAGRSTVPGSTSTISSSAWRRSRIPYRGRASCRLRAGPRLPGPHGDAGGRRGQRLAVLAEMVPEPAKGRWAAQAPPRGGDPSARAAPGHVGLDRAGDRARRGRRRAGAHGYAFVVADEEIDDTLPDPVIARKQRDKEDRGEAAMIAAITLYSVGGALVATGITLLLWPEKKPEAWEEVPIVGLRLAPVVTDGGGGAVGQPEVLGHRIRRPRVASRQARMARGPGRRVPRSRARGPSHKGIRRTGPRDAGTARGRGRTSDRGVLGHRIRRPRVASRRAWMHRKAPAGSPRSRAGSPSHKGSRRTGPRDAGTARGRGRTADRGGLSLAQDEGLELEGHEPHAPVLDRLEGQREHLGHVEPRPAASWSVAGV